jgi:hypothetical protein
VLQLVKRCAQDSIVLNDPNLPTLNQSRPNLSPTTQSTPIFSLNKEHALVCTMLAFLASNIILPRKFTLVPKALKRGMP